MKENKYDDNIFFQKYSQMSRSQKGLAGAGEWETLKKMLPDFKGKRVLDLGCGYGWHCIYAMENGASSVVGVDICFLLPSLVCYKDAVIGADCAVQDLELSLSDGIRGNVCAAVIGIPGHEVDVALRVLGPIVVAVRRPCGAIPGDCGIEEDGAFCGALRVDEGLALEVVQRLITSKFRSLGGYSIATYSVTDGLRSAGILYLGASRQAHQDSENCYVKPLFHLLFKPINIIYFYFNYNTIVPSSSSQSST